jgi:hypothetical protein
MAIQNPKVDFWCPSSQACSEETVTVLKKKKLTKGFGDEVKLLKLFITSILMLYNKYIHNSSRCALICDGVYVTTQTNV